ncbi:MAG: enoyl-CoA hydratase-related protein [Chloroflexi bacterium]|nr:enoyl-CoA hydratase-related protein [Chloroflexota bacterium]MCY3588569.1 enoyl-CoA hydratase-related protein [Chloroflexota bacterium]MCY3685613.1 enoyl-CoA hydratase-related protein [Chloroflexota bacterium]MDE2708515.1 enoyl-CoA hydratase-related protein [Chloroflexota bacterium]
MTVRIDTDGKIATITLDRPERMNAINPEMSRQLDEFWEAFDQDDNLHVAIITGSGRAFCAGRDLVRPDAHDDEINRAARSAANRESGAANATGLSSWGPDKTWKPTIAAINGWCLAGGFALALSCDLRIMSDTARIGSMAPKRGLLPGGGQVQRLARYVPFGKALELLLRANHLDAREAERIGLANAVTTPDDLLPTAREWAEEIASNGPLAVRASKRAAYEGVLLQTGFADGMALESQLYSEIMVTEDAREGTTAFAEKRPAQFKGR